MRRYPAYLFDLDGTLLHSIDLIIECFRHSLTYAGGRVPSDADIRRSVGLPLHEEMALHLRGVPGVDLDDVIAEHMRYQLAHWQDKVHLYPGARQTLCALAGAGAKLALVTSRRRQTAELYTRHFGIGDLFESMVTPEDTSRHKPDAAPARLALARLEVEPSAALFVGDARFDIECGRAAGTATCLVAHPARADAYEGPEADYVIRNLAELTE